MVYILIFLTGIIAGFLNTLAGGGSILALPVLIMAGIPSPMANATNRVAILLQNMTGVLKFHHHRQLIIKPILHITIAASLGALAGAFFAVKIDSALFDRILGLIMIGLLILIFRPQKTRNFLTKRLPRWLEIIIFLMVGFYGGFIQVGVGFIFLATLNLVEEFDLIRANAVKVFIILCYTSLAVLIFALSGKIIWKYGLILSLGNMLGAYLGVHSAISHGERFVRYILLIAILLACLKLFGILDLIGLF